MNLQRFNSITSAEMAMVDQLFYSSKPLSDYLAGQERGGYYVKMLEEEWADAFHVKHAIACNSATSGLLAAAFAIGLEPDDTFAVSPMTMSATAAAPMFTGAKPFFFDVSMDDFAMEMPPAIMEDCRAVFITNLFGHPGQLAPWRGVAEALGGFLIEDNAQSPFAMYRGRYAGTVGHIGVFSLNIHKPLQCGEGGVIVTDDNDLAGKMREFINHGEHRSTQVGLNLRMPELCAAVAVVQLRRGKHIIEERICQAEAILAAIGDIPGVRPPVVREGCTHVYYTIPFLIDTAKRGVFCAALKHDGVPIIEHYVKPLYRLPAFEDYPASCPVAERVYRELFYIENCAWTFTGPQIKLIGDAFKRAADKVL